MKLGVKTYGEIDFLKEFEDKVDFFEVMALDNLDTQTLDFLTKTKTPIIIHAQHRGFGVNNADQAKEKKNRQAIETAINFANKFNARKIITHPGELDTKYCSKKYSTDFIRSLKDKRIMVENLPYDNNLRLCSTPENTRSYLEESGTEFCFDINHAISAALQLNIDYLEFIKRFIKLNPGHYHLGGQKIKDKDVTHLDFQESEIDLKRILEVLPEDAKITLEVTVDIEKTKHDLKVIQELMQKGLSKTL